MLDQSERQAIVDQEHLKLLPLYYWVSGGFLGAYALFMLAYFIFIGVMFTSLSFEDAASAPPPAFGWMFIGMGVAGFLFVAAFVAVKVLAGFWIAKRKNRVGVMIAAGLSCLEFPYGTLVGVLTFIVLARPSVTALFESSKREMAPPLAAAADEAAVDGVRPV
ncbi:MAG: hypothetical protein U1E29_11865 [Coriobacteriia bacterium]|nr:hypothetical protein [Coriobacteriia bacterium]